MPRRSTGADPTHSGRANHTPRGGASTASRAEPACDAVNAPAATSTRPSRPRPARHGTRQRHGRRANGAAGAGSGPQHRRHRAKTTATRTEGNERHGRSALQEATLFPQTPAMRTHCCNFCTVQRQGTRRNSTPAVRPTPVWPHRATARLIGVKSPARAVDRRDHRTHRGGVFIPVSRSVYVCQSPCAGPSPARVCRSCCGRCRFRFGPDVPGSPAPVTPPLSAQLHGPRRQSLRRRRS